MATTPLTGQEVLDRYFLEVRCKLLDIAAVLDRIDRSTDSGGLNDPRRQTVDRALEVIAGAEGRRAERVQMLFSRDYDPQWAKEFEEARRGIH